MAIPGVVQRSLAVDRIHTALVSWEQSAAPPLASFTLLRVLDCVCWRHGGHRGLALTRSNLPVNADALQRSSAARALGASRRLRLRYGA